MKTNWLKWLITGLIFNMFLVANTFAEDIAGKITQQDETDVFIELQDVKYLFFYFQNQIDINNLSEDQQLPIYTQFAQSSLEGLEDAPVRLPNLDCETYTEDSETAVRLADVVMLFLYFQNQIDLNSIGDREAAAEAFIDFIQPSSEITKDEILDMLPGGACTGEDETGTDIETDVETDTEVEMAMICNPPSSVDFDGNTVSIGLPPAVSVPFPAAPAIDSVEGSNSWSAPDNADGYAVLKCDDPESDSWVVSMGPTDYDESEAGSLTSDGNPYLVISYVDVDELANSSDSCYELTEGGYRCFGDYTTIDNYTEGGDVEDSVASYFNGEWTGVLFDEDGCSLFTENPNEAAFTINATDGVLAGSLGSFGLSGNVRADGKVEIMAAGQTIPGMMHLDGSASGTWDISALAAGCSGDWSATNPDVMDGGDVSDFDGTWTLNLNTESSCAAFTGTTGTYEFGMSSGTISGTASTNLGEFGIGGLIFDGDQMNVELLGTPLGDFEFPGTLDPANATAGGTWEVTGLAGCSGDWDASMNN